MLFGRIPHIESRIARLVLGTHGTNTKEVAAPVMDAYFGHGGNCIDTAHIYSQGECERIVGDWLQDRGVRDEIVLLGKGAHTPDCFPEMIAKQLDTSLERLQTDYVDLYMLHRDNPDVPVGEFVTALAELQKRGTIRALGVSNWSLDRVEEANAFADANSLPRIVGVSNHFSLAEMVAEPWEGCVASSDEASRSRLVSAGLALFPWSTLAHGFLTPNGLDQAAVEDAPQHSWWSAENVARWHRADELARQRDTSLMAVSLAFVLAQPFPTFPLVGPRTVEELNSTLAVEDVVLTPGEVEWLASGTGELATAP